MKKTVALLVLLAFFSLNCYNHRYNIGNGGREDNVVYEEWQHHYLFAILGGADIDVRQYCPSGDATISNQVSAVNALIAVGLSIVTAGIGPAVWMTSTVKITCDEGKKVSSVDISPEKALNILSQEKFIDYLEHFYPEKLAEGKVAHQRALTYIALKSGKQKDIQLARLAK